VDYWRRDGVFKSGGRGGPSEATRSRQRSWPCCVGGRKKKEKAVSEVLYIRETASANSVLSFEASFGASTFCKLKT
jgi:hypothetical protein